MVIRGGVGGVIISFGNPAVCGVFETRGLSLPPSVLTCLSSMSGGGVMDWCAGALGWFWLLVLSTSPGNGPGGIMLAIKPSCSHCSGNIGSRPVI